MLDKKIKLKDREKIIHVCHRYGLSMFAQWAVVAFFFLAPFFLMFWLFQNGVVGQVVFAGLVLLGSYLLFRYVFLWRKNVFVVTTHRLIDLEQRGFFENLISEVPFDQIEDIFGKVSGFWGTIFGFGDVEVQTGGGKVKIIGQKVKRPHYLQQEINELRERFLSKYAHDFSGDVAESIIDKLYELDVPELIRVKKVLARRLEKLDTTQ